MPTGPAMAGEVGAGTPPARVRGARAADRGTAAPDGDAPPVGCDSLLQRARSGPTVDPCARTRWTLLAAGVLLGVLVAVPPTPAGAAPGTDAAVPPLVALGGAGNLDHGWVASFTYDYTIPTPVAPTITYDTGTTGVAGSTSPNVLDGTMTSQGRTFSVQASLPVGQTIAAGRSYQSDLDGAAIQVTWPGGGCASSAYGGGDWFAMTSSVAPRGVSPTSTPSGSCASRPTGP